MLNLSLSKGIACRSVVYLSTSEFAWWLIAAVHGDSTYISYVSIMEMPSFFFFLPPTLVAFISFDPFVVSGYNMPLSCDNINVYESLYYYVNNVTIALPLAQSGSDPGVDVSQLVYYTSQIQNTTFWKPSRRQITLCLCL